ncbi:putative PEP-CTERM system histidine kinase [Chitinivorax tropicus]|uniref:histidine kinase n=1 Tax=Chitinivorax tropicus TaxID=714531 RepID=A0A840MFZ4_9PROT|nr:XrtA/PEP-CTERM system histidine kinase PrsK [Chitinivorax tropicus]MBB5017320.1 putative PEP-CTERM system histidine kinase [Chitinivorax tropicus]
MAMELTVGMISYGLAAAAYAGLAVRLYGRVAGDARNLALVAACLGSLAWAVICATSLPYLPRWPLEAVRNLLWFVFVLSVLRGSLDERTQQLAKRLNWAVIAVFGGVIAAQLVVSLYRPAHTWPLIGLVAGPAGYVIQVLIGLVLLEQLFRNTHAEQRWGVKFLCLGLAGIYVTDFYMYSEALLFRGLDRSTYEVRGFVAASMALLIGISWSRNPEWELTVSLSRRMLLQSATLLAAGSYLLLMAAAGYYIRFFGGDWGGVLQAFFLFAAVVSLLAALFSGTIRAYVKVFVSKHFFTYRYDYREEWLRFTRALSEGEPGVHLRERSIRAIAELVESPGGNLWLRDEHDQFVPSARWNMVEILANEPASSSLCRFLEERQWVVDVQEYKRSPAHYVELSALPDWLEALNQPRLIIPLILHERMIGFVVLAEFRSQLSLNWEVNDLLKTAARQAAGFLAQLEAAQALLVSRQFESFNRMSAFVVHDLKNVVAQLSLMLKNAARHKHNPAFQDDMLETVGHAIDKMNRLLMQLRKGAQSIDKPELTELSDIILKVVADKSEAAPQPAVLICKKGLVVHADNERLQRVVGHLVQNAVEATPPTGEVSVCLDQLGNHARIEVSDTGKGMSSQFIRERLFRPFETTKSMGMGIGTYESREYIRQLGGNIDVRSEEGKGTTFVVTLPLAQAAI